MRTTKLLSALALGLGLALASASASALQWYAPFTTFEDDNLDYVFDNDNDGFISVGDRFVSVLEFNRTAGINAGQGPSNIGPADELTAVADVTLVAILNAGTTLVFAPSGAAGVLAGFAPGTTIAVFLDPTPDLNVINATCGTRAQCLALAGLGLTDGSAVFLTAGFAGDLDEAWIASVLPGGLNLAQVAAAPATSKFGLVNLSQSIIVNNTGKIFTQQPCVICGLGGDGLVDLVGSADILGGQGLNTAEWTARSDTDAQLAIAVPEPGSLALMGLALAGLGALRRRK